MGDKSCYNCHNFGLCRLRDKACELKDYFNKTGNFMGDNFATELYKLMGANCSEFKPEFKKKENDGN